MRKRTVVRAGNKAQDLVDKYKEANERLEKEKQEYYMLKKYKI